MKGYSSNHVKAIKISSKINYWNDLCDSSKSNSTMMINGTSSATSLRLFSLEIHQLLKKHLRLSGFDTVYKNVGVSRPAPWVYMAGTSRFITKEVVSARLHIVDITARPSVLFISYSRHEHAVFIIIRGGSKGRLARVQYVWKVHFGFN